MSARILYVVNVGWFFVSHRLVLAKAALAAGYEVHAATTITDPSERAAIVSAGIVLHDLNFDRSGFHPLDEWRTVRALLALYRGMCPQLIHHVSIKPILYGGLVARLAGVPAIVNAIPGLGYSFAGSSLPARARRALIMLGYRVALSHANSRVIFQNREHLDMFCDSGVVSRARTVLIRGSGVNVAQYVPSPEPVGPLTVLLASRMLREKGIFEFVAAARHLRATHRNVRFLLVGDVDPGNPGSIDVQQLRDWHAEGSVEWLGYRRDVADLLAQSHIACLPTYGEGLPKFLLEAAACARPLVTTDIPGCRDIARPGLNALLVPPRDPVALQAALHELLRDAELRRRFGAAGRALVEQEFSEERVLAQTLGIYRDLLAVSS
jgi:glycosyltransferase involved in cell wall biosynthesis